MRTIRLATAATMLAAALLSTAVGTAAAQPSDALAFDTPGLIQDVAESVTVEDVQVGLVNVQDIASNAVPVNALGRFPVSAEGN
ncbi:hypothetical protein [Streptomyces sp. NPDC006193]|uniref:hypothetical protein n=1 Tax=Streptomyces sp. NPDC006193 TaxID=3155717 RepID=UPI0033A8A3E5